VLLLGLVDPLGLVPFGFVLFGLVPGAVPFGLFGFGLFGLFGFVVPGLFGFVVLQGVPAPGVQFVPGSEFPVVGEFGFDPGAPGVVVFGLLGVLGVVPVGGLVAPVGGLTGGVECCPAVLPVEPACPPLPALPDEGAVCATAQAAQPRIAINSINLIFIMTSTVKSRLQFDPSVAIVGGFSLGLVGEQPLSSRFCTFGEWIRKASTGSMGLSQND
jgi:hypothetical protein